MEDVVALGLVPALLVVGVLTAGVSAGQAYPRARAAAYGGFRAEVLGATGLVFALHGVALGRMPFSGPRVLTVELLGGAALGEWTTLGYIRLRRAVRRRGPEGATPGAAATRVLCPAARASVSRLLRMQAPLRLVAAVDSSASPASPASPPTARVSFGRSRPGLA